MSKIDTGKVAEIIKSEQLDPAVLRSIMEKINLAVQPYPSEEDAPPAVKKQFVILISDPENRFPAFDFAGWVLQIPEDESPATTQERIFRGAYDFNCTRKGRLYPAKTVGEALENVPAKHFKECELWLKTKIPVLILKTDNQIPRDNGSRGDLKTERSVDAGGAL